MSKIQNPVIGRAKGSAGGMTFAKQFDKNTMRAKPFEVANPKTQGQTTQRDFFKQVQEIVASVSPEQLRSLFGNMPKGMSRRNALSKQVAEAYSMDGTTKSVDFSKLQAIGNGDKVYTPCMQIVDESPVSSFEITANSLGVPSQANPNLIIIVFDTNRNSINIINTMLTLDEELNYANFDFSEWGIQNGYFYVTCAKNGENVYLRGFGSFIIKTRAEKSGSQINKGTPKAGDVVTLSGTSSGSTATLNFANYDFNDLVPGDLIQGETGSEVTLVDSADWVEGSNNEFGADLAAAYDHTKATYLQILQGGDVVDTIPFSVVVE